MMVDSRKAAAIAFATLVVAVISSVLCAGCPASRHETTSNVAQTGQHVDGFITPYACYFYGDFRIDLMGGIGSIRAIAFAENKPVITSKRIGRNICTVSEASLGQVLRSREIMIDGEIVRLNVISIDESLRKMFPFVSDNTRWTYSEIDNTLNLVISKLGKEHLDRLESNDILLMFVEYGAGYEVNWLPILN